MSEPPSSRVRTDREVALQAIEENRRLRARVAELEKERDELTRVFDANVRLAAQKWDAIERADRAEAALATAQEALKTYGSHHLSCPVHIHVGYIRECDCGLADVLARGGGQQETGQ